MRTVMLLCGLVLGATALAAFAGKESDSLTMNAKARVDVDAEGRVTEVAFLDSENMIAAVREPLDRAIRSWAFEPARVGERAVSSATTVSVGLRAERLGDEDAFVLRITSASAGPARTVHEPPRYPIDAIRANLSGRVVVRVSFDEHGVPAEVVTEEAEFSRSDRKHQAKALVQATHEAVRAWRFQPELVDGRPLASSVLVPVTYCLYRVGDRRDKRPKGGGCFEKKQAEFPDGTLLAEQPATRLLTEVIGTRL